MGPVPHRRQGSVCLSPGITNHGKHVREVAKQDRGSGQTRMSKETFPGMAPKQIQEYRFETMAYDWVTFKEVPLRPGLESFKGTTLEGPPRKTAAPAATPPSAGPSR